jgi:integrase
MIPDESRGVMISNDSNGLSSAHITYHHARSSQHVPEWCPNMPKLTQSLVTSIKATDKDSWVADSDLPGMYLRIQPSGRKTIVIRYRNKYGTSRKYTVARVQDAPIAQLRDLAREKLLDVRKGGDPAADKALVKENPTVAELADMFMSEAVVARKKSSIDLYRYLLRRWLIPSIGKVRLAELTPQHVSKMRDTYGSVSPVAANRAVKLVRQLWTFGESRQLCDGKNPAALVKLYREKANREHLSPELLRDILTHINKPEANHAFRILVLLLMYTGCRVNEIATARTEWVNFDTKTLHLPDSKTGAKKVSIPDIALEFIDRRLPYVCGIIINNPHDMMCRMRKRLNLPHFTYHQLRHTFASVALNSGISVRDVADLLGHANSKTTMLYLHGMRASRANDAANGIESYIAQ